MRIRIVAVIALLISPLVFAQDEQQSPRYPAGVGSHAIDVMLVTPPDGANIIPYLNAILSALQAHDVKWPDDSAPKMIVVEAVISRSGEFSKLSFVLPANLTDDDLRRDTPSAKFLRVVELTGPFAALPEDFKGESIVVRFVFRTAQ